MPSSPAELSDRNTDPYSPSSQPRRARRRHTRWAMVSASWVNCAEVGARTRRSRGLRCSIRVNRQWRVCFVWTESGPKDVEIVDYH